MPGARWAPVCDGSVGLSHQLQRERDPGCDLSARPGHRVEGIFADSGTRRSGDDLTHQGVLLLGGLFGLLALQTLLQTINETSASILRVESAQQVNARIMGKMSRR